MEGSRGRIWESEPQGSEAAVQVVAGPAQGADYRDPHARAGIRGPRAGAAGGATEREGAPLRRHQLPIRLVIQ